MAQSSNAGVTQR